MLSLFVTFRTKPGRRDDFIKASLENARGSINGPGSFATSILADPEDENVSHVFEVFADEDALDAHHQEAYYKTWEAASNEMLAEPYTYIKNSNFPTTDGLKLLKRAAGA